MSSSTKRIGARAANLLKRRPAPGPRAFFPHPEAQCAKKPQKTKSLLRIFKQKRSQSTRVQSLRKPNKLAWMLLLLLLFYFPLLCRTCNSPGENGCPFPLRRHCLAVKRRATCKKIHERRRIISPCPFAFVVFVHRLRLCTIRCVIYLFIYLSFSFTETGLNRHRRTVQQAITFLEISCMNS